MPTQQSWRWPYIEALKAQSQVWDKFWQFKALLKWWKILLFHLTSSYRSEDIEAFISR